MPSLIKSCFFYGTDRKYMKQKERETELENYLISKEEPKKKKKIIRKTMASPSIALVT